MAPRRHLGGRGLGGRGIGQRSSSAGFSPTTALLAAPATPTLTLTTGATDNTPGFQFDGAIVELDTVRFQYDTHSDFSAPSDITNTIDAAEDAANQLTFSTGTLADGTWYFRARIERPLHFPSLWSNTETETIDATAPTISTSGTQTVAENVALSVSLTANETVTWAIRTAVQNAASLDHDEFEISGTTLRFTSNGTHDFESPTDTNTDNAYVVVIRATDTAGNTTDKTITVTVTNVAEGWAGPSTGLTHRWPMDAANVSGATVSDVVGTDHGTISGTVTAGTGPSGAANAARTFDGSTGLIALGSSPAISFATAFSIGLWVDIANVTAAGSGGFADRFMNFTDGVVEFALYNDQGSGGKGSYQTSAGNLTGGVGAVFVNNTWAHFVLTFDGIATFKTYLNGALDTAGTPPGIGTTANNIIGARDATPNGAWAGSMAQLVIYDVELSAGDVTQLYNAF